MALCDRRALAVQVGVFRRYGADIGMTETEPAELELMLRQTGYEQIHTELAEDRLVFGSEEEWWLWSWSHGTRVLFEAVPTDRLVALRGDSHLIRRGPQGLPQSPT